LWSPEAPEYCRPVVLPGNYSGQLQRFYQHVCIHQLAAPSVAGHARFHRIGSRIEEALAEKTLIAVQIVGAIFLLILFVFAQLIP